MIPWGYLIGRLNFVACLLNICRRNAQKLGRWSGLGTDGLAYHHSALSSFGDRVERGAKRALRCDARRMLAEFARVAAIVRGCLAYQLSRIVPVAESLTALRAKLAMNPMHGRAA